MLRFVVEKHEFIDGYLPQFNELSAQSLTFILDEDRWVGSQEKIQTECGYPSNCQHDHEKPIRPLDRHDG